MRHRVLATELFISSTLAGLVGCATGDAEPPREDELVSALTWPSTCGNAVLDAGEGCDDGNRNPSDGCNQLCKIENAGACNTVAPGLTSDAGPDSDTIDP